MNQHVCCPGCEPDAHIAHPTTPRVAESLDDLRVGMVVTHLLNDEWHKPGAVVAIEPGHCGKNSFVAFDPCQWVILSDPPPVPVRVPADLIDALAEALAHQERFDEAYQWREACINAARAVVDAARNGTDQ